MRLPFPRPRSLAGQLFAMQVVLVAAIVAGCAVFAYVTDRAQAEETARRQSTATATAVAESPSVVEAVRSADPTARLQPYAESLRGHAGVNFVVIMAPDGTRWTHPEPAEIGRTYLGHIEPAVQGRIFSETHMGVLGPSVRTVAPVYDDGRVIALVSAGITIETISEQVREQVTALLGMAGAALALGGIGTYVINARLRRHTHGMNAAELSRMHDYHEAALHAVSEGLVMLDGQRRIALINDGARELLGLDATVVGRPAAELGLPTSLTGALLSSEPRVDELHLTVERVLVVNTRPVVGGERRGTVVTLRDRTELQALSGELTSERGFTQALRSQAHEAANRLHTVVSLIELGRVDEAVGFATAELELAQALTDRVVDAVGEPVLAALLLGKAAQANERGVELVLTEDSRIDDGLLPPAIPSRDLVTILGNLIDNAVEAASGTLHPRVTVTALARDGELLIRVGDTGPGVDEEDADAVFERGWSTHGAGRGLGLALVRQATARASGTVTLARSPEGGAEFTVRLPLTSAPGPAAPATAGQAPDGGGADGGQPDTGRVDAGQVDAGRVDAGRVDAGQVDAGGAAASVAGAEAAV
ncbi:sensor histidine kinase [Streptomyces sp. ISL-36]|uniref:sensor histidine kinase n=1 Tax=Streptomyces sp. ISL-36 TaxID=2819182 RepID=UPI001BE6920B|nr:sensor histidine kinase [Streptomyces sp. ISL-36]MBT2439733.1 sensor histidine kinase [Streptomyces sp. ISL-36]